MSNKIRVPIVCLDFDGVLHSYVSGWRGAREISDPPVPGAIEFVFHLLVSGLFQVCILSSRSHKFGGRRAMRLWMRDRLEEVLWDKYEENKLPIEYTSQGMDGIAVADDMWRFAQDLVETIEFPKHKPPAHITIDDRAFQFVGQWPSIEELVAFEPYRCPEPVEIT